MKIIGVIPSRYASTRFPGKPLVQIAGKSMIRRVYEQALKCASLDMVVVATDDQRIVDEVSSFGGSFIMTSNKHESGTDRCAEVIGHYEGFDTVINIQGDEPFIDPIQIDLIAGCFKDPHVELATLVKQITTEQELFNTNIPKVVLNTAGEAVYFSRQTIPYLRNAPQAEWLSQHVYYKHIGIYGYRKDALLAVTKLAPSSLERAEHLEQLRWLEHGYRIKTAITTIETHAIDSPEDLIKVL